MKKLSSELKKVANSILGRMSGNQLEQKLNENNQQYGTDFSLGNTYGNWELWAKGNRLEAGSLDDVYRAWIKYRFNEKYKK